MEEEACIDGYVLHASSVVAPLARAQGLGRSPRQAVAWLWENSCITYSYSLSFWPAIANNWITSSYFDRYGRIREKTLKLTV